MESYLPIALGFFAGFSLGLLVCLALCVWWVRTIHKSMFEEAVAPEAFGVNAEESGEACAHEEEPEEWWKKS